MLTLAQHPRTGPSPLLWEGLCALLSYHNNESPTRPREIVTGGYPNVGSATMARDKFGRAHMTFDGVAEKLQWPDSSTFRRPGAQVSVYTRILLPGSSPGSSLFGKDLSGGTTYSYGMEANTSEQPTAWINTGTNTVLGAATVLPATWVNLFMRWASGGPLSLEGYYDGGRVAVSKVNSANVTGTLAYDAGPLFLGVNNPSGTRYLAFSHSSFGVWNRRLTDAEIMLLAQDPQVLFRRTFTPVSLLVAALPPAWEAGTLVVG